jgi:type I restriction enzyme S subunit
VAPAQQSPDTETGAQLLERILTERRARWEAKQLAKFSRSKAKLRSQRLAEEIPRAGAARYQPNLPELPEGWVWASVQSSRLTASKFDAGLT